MFTLREYRNKQTINAEYVDADGMYSTYDGVRFIPKGDYIVHIPGFGTKHVEAAVFENEYVLIPNEEILAREFSPAGKTVEYVLEFMRNNPQEVERIKAEEANGGKRKTIQDYEDISS